MNSHIYEFRSIPDDNYMQKMFVYKMERKTRLFKVKAVWMHAYCLFSIPSNSVLGSGHYDRGTFYITIPLLGENSDPCKALQLNAVFA